MLWKKKRAASVAPFSFRFTDTQFSITAPIYPINQLLLTNQPNNFFPQLSNNSLRQHSKTPFPILIHFIHHFFMRATHPIIQSLLYQQPFINRRLTNQPLPTLPSRLIRTDKQLPITDQPTSHAGQTRFL